MTVRLTLCYCFISQYFCHDCEAWSNISENDYKQLQNAQLAFLRKVMEVTRSTPVAATFLELGILPITSMKLRRDSCCS